MIRLPEGFGIHPKDRHHLACSNWEVRIRHWSNYTMWWTDAFYMAKYTGGDPMYFEKQVKYAGRFIVDKNHHPWIHFDSLEDLCIVMTTRYRMSIR